jgi:alcohol dehydrogenase (cytochrome c)
MRLRLLITAFLLAGGATAWAQGVDNPMLLQPPADSWPQYNGTYNGQRHAKLKQITPQNVGSLALAWAFQTRLPGEIKSTPLLVDGVIYFTTVDNVWAVDALSGRQLWHYNYPPGPGLHIGSRGVAMYKDQLYFLVPDGHLISLNAKDGTVRWKVTIADVTKGYWTSMAPLVVGNHVMVGTSGDFDNLVGYIRSVDPETGATQWQWNATPPLGTAGAATGGNSWMTGT